MNDRKAFNDGFTPDSCIYAPANYGGKYDPVDDLIYVT